LDDLVMALLAKDPDDRPSSAAEVRDRLRELSAATPASGAGSDLSGADMKTVTTPLTGAGPGTAQTPVPVPGPGAGTPMPAGRISRRTALRLGIGASITAALGTGVAAAVNLFDHNTTDHKTPKTPDPRLRWRYATGDAVTSSPAVVDGVVYIGSTDGSVYALDVTTGKKKWAYATGDKVEGTPAVVDGVVYIGSTDGSVYALHAATGERKWAYATGDKFEAAPTAVDGMVYIAGYNSVTALNAATGNEKWVRRASDWGFDRKDEWDNTPEDWRFTPPTVADGVVYIGSSKRVYALDAVTGKKRWAFDTGGTVEGTPTVADGVVYIGSFDHNVYALDAVTGNKKWSYATGGRVRSSPAVVDGVVYVGGQDHNVYALDVTIEGSSA
jgi:serine/threonine-protein kinase